MDSKKAHRSSMLQLHLSVLLAGVTGLFGKIPTLHPGFIVCGRTLCALIVLGVISRWMKISLRVGKGRDLLIYIASGAGLALHWYGFFMSIHVSTVAIGLLAFSAFPLFVTLMEPFFFRERLRRADTIAALLVVLGLIIVSREGQAGGDVVKGLLWGLLSSLAVASVTLISRSTVRGQSALTVSFYQQVFACLFTLPLALIYQKSVSGTDILYILLLGTIFTALLQVLYISSLRHLRAQIVSMAFGLEPVYGTLFAILLLHEHPGLKTLIGGILILCAVMWSSLQHVRIKG